VDRDIGRDRRAAGRQRLEDQNRGKPRQSRSAHILGDVNAAHAEFGGLAHFVDGKVLGFVPGQRIRRKEFIGEGARHVANGDLLLIEGELRLRA
jgi:hypothetical protein